MDQVHDWSFLTVARITVMLLVFSLLTKMRPVSLVAAGVNADSESSAKARLRIAGP
ncbi:MAG: hypothetical protein WBF03_11620 [Xanthobacteraceae bacterium]